MVRGTLKRSAICWTVRPARVVGLLSEDDLLCVAPGWAPALASARACSGESVARVGDDQLTLELGEDGEHPEHCSPFSRRGVDAVLDHVQADAAIAQLGAEGHEVQDRTAETVEAGDLQRVALAQHAQDNIELWAAGLRAAGVVDVDVRAGGGFSS